MYVDIRSVGGKPPAWRCRADRLGLRRRRLDTTFQSAGAVTVKVNAALRSGCSKVVNTRRASGTSNCV